MKNIFFLLTNLFFIGCSTNSGEFIINGSIDLKDGDMVYRVIADSNQQPMVVDSITVVNGTFEMSGIVESPDVNSQLGFRLLLKMESFQRTGSFKFRGAFNKISKLV